MKSICLTRRSEAMDLSAQQKASNFFALFAVICLMQCGFVSPLISKNLSSSNVYVDDQGRLQNLLISINLNIKQAESREAYLAALKTHVTGLSESVYELTGLQFGNVTILVPSDWRGDLYPQTYNQAAESAEVVVQPLEVELYTQHIQGCGKQALFMAIDTAYITAYNGTKVKPKKKLMHEWLHTRYGVFDEHPLERRPDLASDPTAIDQQRFYHSSGSGQEAVRCSLALETENDCLLKQSDGYVDVNIQTFLPNNRCTFTVLPPEVPAPSLMSNPETDNVDQLCDRETHNDEAPNRQNRLCNGRSIMEVLSDHEDFKKLEEVTRKLGNASYKNPVFSVQSMRTDRTIVIVLDTSKSMKGSRLSLAVQAIGSMVEHIIEDYASIMIIGFDGNARKLYPLDRDTPVELDSKESRLEVLEALTDVTTGPYTCIGCGLELGYNLIKGEKRSASGTFFVLLTDGHENKNKDKLEELFMRSAREGFFIDTILLSDETGGELADLVSDAGSRVFSATDDPAALVDAYTDIITSRQQPSTQVSQIYSQLETVKANQNTSNQFIVEPSLMELAEIVFYWNASAQPFLSFSVTRENDGHTLLSKTRATLSKLGYLKVSLYDEQYRVDSHPLRFRYHIENTHPSLSFPSTVTVDSRRGASKEYHQESRMQAFVDGEHNFTISSESILPRVSIHAYLPLGSTDGLPDNVTATVTATSLTNNQTDEFKVKLRDLGTGADVIGGDRVYSGFFTNYVTYNATYYVRIRAIGSRFMRYSSPGFFVVYIMLPSNGTADLLSSMVRLPPSPIVDLRVVETNMNEVKVEFTAPRDDSDSGTGALYYRGWFTNSSKKLRGRHESVSVVNFTVLPSAEELAYRKERAVIDIPATVSIINETVWVGITAIEEHGLESDMSNLVSSRYTVGIRSIFNTTEDACPPGTIVKCLANVYFYVIIAIVVVIGLVFMGLIALHLYRRLSSGEAEQPVV